jgi:hypothetical protein
METIEILRALLELIAQGNFNVNTKGAHQISGLMDATEAHVRSLEEELEEELREVTDNV